MKQFDQQTYYEILDLTPAAKPPDIRDAYRTALEMYQDESLASYSFFDEDERKTILSKLEEAFLALIDTDSKADYDQDLIRRGLINKDALDPTAQHEPILIDVLKRFRRENRVPVIRSKNLKSREMADEHLNNLLNHDVITGADLRKIRINVNISLDQISDETKIRTTYLEAIENDEFDKLPSRFHLKSFLRAYLKSFASDVEPYVERYLKRVE
ncbi:MAG TPA: hypothetical protein ENO00_05355 [Deltaproteobacteria bacterium]|nr:hypothetical protein [Deltaproteobacteria bacterium]